MRGISLTSIEGEVSVDTIHVKLVENNKVQSESSTRKFYPEDNRRGICVASENKKTVFPFDLPGVWNRSLPTGDTVWFFSQEGIDISIEDLCSAWEDRCLDNGTPLLTAKAILTDSDDDNDTHEYLSEIEGSASSSEEEEDEEEEEEDFPAKVD